MQFYQNDYLKCNLSFDFAMASVDDIHSSLFSITFKASGDDSVFVTGRHIDIFIMHIEKSCFHLA